MSNLERSKPVKMILVTGGVISGIGKGVISSSLGVLLKAHGYRVSVIKIDPYINIDAGTFSPFEHGTNYLFTTTVIMSEVFVLDDGAEVDLDLGNYERFLNVRLTRENNITTGKIYQQVIERERRGDFLGKTVQTIPHITSAIVEWVERVAAIPVDGSMERPEVCIIELGGTVGDIESMPFIAAFEKFQRPAFRNQLMTVHVSIILEPKTTGEPKTKPMQNSVQNLRASGLIPDLLVCRSERPLSYTLREKIAAFAMVDLDQVIVVHDVANIYKVPLLLHNQNTLEMIIERLKLKPVDAHDTLIQKPNLFQWTHLSNLCDSFNEEVRIAMIGKYVKIRDSYASVNKALRHSAIHAKRKLVIEYILSEHLEETEDPLCIPNYNNAWEAVRRCDGILVPGGFGGRGIEGKIAACKYARENNIPFLGICLGMQCAVIEFARNVCGIKGANSTEFDLEIVGEQQVVIDMPEHKGDMKGMGGTMRLGKLYGVDKISERHRHRYEVNPSVVPRLCTAGLLFVGIGTDEKMTLDDIENILSTSEKKNGDEIGSEETYLLRRIHILCQSKGETARTTPVRMEIIELQNHPYFVGVQFHPEYLSSPLQPSPPYFGFICAASNQLGSFLRGSKIPSPMSVLKEAEDYVSSLRFSNYFKSIVSLEAEEVIANSSNIENVLQATHIYVNEIGEFEEKERRED
ncbi:unnamed protein product [Thelazia callipaeda]|uniref:CTP synthase n=1 Tax=Thelazia callipaeda TaxID=103827 RepID=A0A158RAT3_THECL|nr:unnamed protein product [Thelazia callipaeda]